MWSRFLREILFTLYGTGAVLLGPIMAQGATYVVATTGNDSNPGTLSQPFKSFAQGVSRLQPGDTLYIRGGLYTEQIDLQRLNKTGTAGKYITIAGYPDETVTLQYTDLAEKSYGPIKARGIRGYFIFENLVLDGIKGTNLSGWSIRDGNHHFILRNLEIKNFKTNGLYISSASDIQIIHCTIHDQISVSGEPGERWYGIYFHDGSNSVIEGNKLYNNPGGGIQAYPGPISNLVIRNNAIYSNNFLATSSVPGIIVMQGGVDTLISGVNIYNNLIYLNGVNQPDPGTSGGIRITNGVTGTRILNNTIYGNKGWGINIQNGLSGIPVNTVVQNNIVWGNTIGQIVSIGSRSVISHNLTTDPKFIKADAFDFRLQAYSPAIDAGFALSQVTTDFLNVLRPKGVTHDIGAYEGGISDLQSPNSPKNLSVK
jgi:parallel beta-helix repeat protein